MLATLMTHTQSTASSARAHACTAAQLPACGAEARLWAGPGWALAACTKLAISSQGLPCSSLNWQPAPGARAHPEVVLAPQLEAGGTRVRKVAPVHCAHLHIQGREAISRVSAIQAALIMLAACALGAAEGAGLAAAPNPRAGWCSRLSPPMTGWPPQRRLQLLPKATPAVQPRPGGDLQGAALVLLEVCAGPSSVPGPDWRGHTVPVRAIALPLAAGWIAVLPPLRHGREASQVLTVALSCAAHRLLAAPGRAGQRFLLLGECQVLRHRLPGTAASGPGSAFCEG